MASPEDKQPALPLADWTPTPEFMATTNLAWLMQRAGCSSYEELHTWSVHHRAEYWALAIERLGVRFREPFHKVLDLSHGVETPQWLTGAKMNIVESCFTAPADSTAILHQVEGGALETMTYGELEVLTRRIAANLQRRGFVPGDALAILMPMTAEAAAIYLGIVAAGCVVVGIADSFQPREIALRLRLSGAKGLFTQDVLIRGGKTFPLYANAVEAEAPPAIVIPVDDRVSGQLRSGDSTWAEFLQSDEPMEPISRTPEDAVNILFSSGTTGEPKAIPWTQTTPIKCAADAHFHQNIQPSDVLVWPTNLGWMMGPWLLFASLMNRAAMGLYSGAPTGRDFGQFVQDAKATMLGVVPSLVKSWRHSRCMNGLDWSTLKLFSSTGECSCAEDMRWLMQLASGRPVVEYCGGTEIGGAYITGTLMRPCFAGTFNTPTLGLDLVILDESGSPAEIGELYLVPPSMGLSTSLLNKDHYEVYFAETPSGPEGELLRRHGDQMERLPGGYWRAQGRADDTMNLGGVKVSSAEIEATLRSVPGILETAAIAISTGGGPSQLVIYAVPAEAATWDHESLANTMRSVIRRDLNPLFKIHDVILIEALPRTASHKIMRRELRARYSTTS